jgi:Tfp pilus assembly protein PilF
LDRSNLKKIKKQSRLHRCKQKNKPKSSQKTIQQQQPSQIVLLGTLTFIVIIFILIAHWPALSAQALCFDDGQYFTGNPLVQHPSWLSVNRFLTEILRPSTVRGYYHPLSMISLMLDYAMGGRVDNLKLFHITSLFLHIMNTILIIVFLYLLFGKPWIAVFVGLLFGVHPIMMETIPWVSERKTLLAAFFILWSLVFYVLYIRQSKRKFYWITLLTYILALLSKPTSISLPFLLLLLDYWPIKRFNKKAIIEKIPFFIVCFVFAVITFLSQKNAAAIITPEKYGVTHILLTLCHNIIFYLNKIIWPINLSAYYPFPNPFNLSHPMVLTGVIGTCLLIVMLIISLRWTRALFTGWLFFFIAIFPTMEVIGFTMVIAANKYAYLPLVGLLLPLAWFLGQLWSKILQPNHHLAKWVGLIALVLLLSIAEIMTTRNYLVYWKNTTTLYRHMLKLTPQSPVLNHELGLILCKQGNLDDGIHLFKEAIRFQPHYVIPYCDLGVAFQVQGNLNEAISYYKKAITINPNYPDSYYNYGIALRNQGKLDEAIAMFRKVIQLSPFDADAHYNIGLILHKQGKVDEAVNEFHTVLRINPYMTNVQKILETL